MASTQESVSMALFCDFENVALGVRDAKLERFDIKPVLEWLLLKGSIVVKKAYCDWDRYKAFKAAMHEASFELIEIPHVRQSGKNSADIRMVVDALDLCYTKSHVDTFVIISGDSDFSPLVSKLRENAKKVIGVGVKQSTSDLLVANCDEFIFYDDLVREQQRAAPKRDNDPASTRTPEDDRRRKQEAEERKAKAIAIAVETFDALASERGESGKIWASVLKSAIKRRKPGFNEASYGFRAFGNLLDEAQTRGFFEVGRDEKSGSFVYRSSGAAVPVSGAASASASAPASASGRQPKASDAPQGVASGDETGVAASSRAGSNDERKGRNKRRKGGNGRHADAASQVAQPAELPPDVAVSSDDVEVEHTLEVARVEQIEGAEQLERAEPPHHEEPAAKKSAKRSTTRRGGRKQSSRGEAEAGADAAQPGVFDVQPVSEAEPENEAFPADNGETAAKKTPAKKAARKSATRARRPRKAVADSDEA